MTITAEAPAQEITQRHADGHTAACAISTDNPVCTCGPADGERTERHECGCVTRSRTWQVPGWDCFATRTVVNCGGHQPAPAPERPADDWEAVLLASVR